MNRLDIRRRAQILGLLVEGNSLRATSRLADVSINTVTKLLVDVGQAASDYQDTAFRNLPCRRVQVDEIWAFCYAKKKNVASAKAAPQGAGDAWTWTAICTETKLVPSWLVATRDAECAKLFMTDLASRMSGRIQLTSDGYKPYLEAVEGAFGLDVDYAQLVKQYGTPADGSDKRHQYIGSLRERITGSPDPTQISTSYVERQNLTMCMGIRRFTRKTNAFSKKIENHQHAVSMHFMYYNFGRIHKALRVTPAMQVGIADHVWTLEEIAALTAGNQVPQKRGPYKKKMVA